jgi:hemerythrin
MVDINAIWNPKLTVGLEYIDDHHKQLLIHLYELQDVIATHADLEKIREMFDALISYTKYHFLAEERLMLKYRYPAIVEHKAEHQKFTDKLDETMLKLNSGNSERVTKELFVFLRDWYIDHIIKKDTQIARHARQG